MNKLKNLLWEIKNEYTVQPAFLLSSEDKLLPVSYEQFYQDVCRQEAYYRRIPQSRAGIWGFNSYEWVISAVGLLLAGKHLILFDANLRGEDLLMLADYTDTELLVVEPDLMEEQEELAGRLLMNPYSCGVDASLEQDASPETDFICFTSGTSKSSKGVVITTESLAGHIRMTDGINPGQSGERYFLPIPLYHIYGFTELFRILKKGGTVCLGRGGRYLLEDMERYRPHVAFLVPSMLQFLLEKDGFLSPLYAVCSGGSVLRPELAKGVMDKGLELYNLYGLSETVGEVSRSVMGRGSQWVVPLKGVRFLQREDGEIGIQPSFCMEGYYKKEEDTCAVLDRDSGIFWTGDAGELKDGAVRFRGRMRDTIVLENGEKIHAEDMDSQLLSVAGVREAAVIHAEGVLVGVFVPEPGTSESDIRRALERLNRTKPVDTRIRRLWLRTEALPRTSAGKLRRFQIEQEYSRNEVQE